MVLVYIRSQGRAVVCVRRFRMEMPTPANGGREFNTCIPHAPISRINHQARTCSFIVIGAQESTIPIDYPVGEETRPA